MSLLLYSSGTVSVFALEVAAAASRSESRQLQQQARAELLAAVLPDYIISHTPAGAPICLLPDSGVGGCHLPSISITHCPTLVAVAIDTSGRAIGLDAEPLSRAAQLRRVLPKFLSDKQISSLPDRESATLTAAWTAKEALYKLLSVSGAPRVSPSLADLPLIPPLPYASRLLTHADTLLTLIFTLTPNYQ